MCAKDDLIRRKGPLQLAEELAIAESVTAKDSNHVNTFSLDFIKCTLEDVNSLFADARLYDLHTRLLFQSGCNTDYPVRVYHELYSEDYTLLAKFIPTTKIRDLFLKTLENAAKSGILLACADGRIRQCYLTILLLTGVKKNRYYMRCTRCLDKGYDDFVHLVNCFRWKHYNFNIHVSLATDILHLLLKGLVIKMLDFMQDILDDIYPSTVISLLFISKAPFALHFIRAVCNLVTLAQYKSYDEDTLAYIQGALERINIFKEEFRHALTHIIQDIRMYRALDSICTRANSEAYYITIVKQFYSITNKKEYILQICLHNSRRTALLAANYATISILEIQPHSTKLLLSEVAANIAISNFTHTAAVSRMSVQIHSSIKCWQSSSKRHNDPKHCNKEVRRDYVWVQEFKHRDNRRQSRIVTDNGKHIAYIGAFSKVLLFNNNRQIDNTTRMLSIPFKFYDLSTIICLVHLVPRDLPNSTTHEYNRLYSPIFDIDLLRTLREYRRKRIRNN
ncbi:hypothetical protein HBH69_209680 [Parastagonospora nodorum]|nr:hypothetical protein HBH69_209680 [Parastagonospora nodorum]